MDPSIQILDPPANPSYLTTVVLTTPFTVVFSACVMGELPQGDSATGCFAGVNGTSSDWTGIDADFPDALGLVGTTFSCNLNANGNIYSEAACPPDPINGFYQTSFDDGTIVPGESFFITETGVDYSAFPPGTAYVTVGDTAVTPEPATWWLLATGLIGFSGFEWKRRQA